MNESATVVLPADSAAQPVSPEDQKGSRVLFSIPTGKHPHCSFHLSVIDMMMSSRVMHERPWRRNDFGYVRGPVQMARSGIAMDFLSRDFDYLLMMDDDIGLDPMGPAGNPIDAFVDFLDRRPDVGMIGAVYLREGPRIPTVSMWHPSYAPRWTGRYQDLGEAVSVVCNFPRVPWEVAGLGTGFVMISRRAMQAVCNRDGGNAGPPFSFSVAKNRWGGTVETGEDFGFCYALQECGFKVYADPRIPTVHFKESGPLVYDWETWHANKDMRLTTDPGALVIQVPCAAAPGGNVTCIDVSEIRKREAADRAAHAKLINKVA